MLRHCIQNTIIIFMVLMLFPIWLYADRPLNIHVDKSTVFMNESFTLYIEINSTSDDIGELNYSSLEENFVVAGSNRSVQMFTRFENGRQTRQYSQTVILDLIPKRPGLHTIGDISVQLGDRRVLSNSIQVEVMEGASSSSNNSSLPNQRAQIPDPTPSDNTSSTSNSVETQTSEGNIPNELARLLSNNNVVIYLTADKNTCYVGEQIVLNAYIYFWRYSISRPQFLDWDIPITFLEKEIDVRNLSPDNFFYTGRRYYRQLIKQKLLYPLEAGNYTIGPFTFQFTYHTFFGGVDKTISNSISIKVKELPTQGRPVNFNGIVGDIEINANLEKMQTSTDDPVNLIINISGSGNPDIISPPDISFLSEDFKIYDPIINEGIEPHSNEGFEFHKEYTFPILPLKTGNLLIPEISISTFNPQTRTYQTKNTQPLTLNVIQGEYSPAANHANGYQNVELTEHIAFLKNNVPLSLQPPYYLLSDENYLYWIYAFIMLIFTGLSFGIYRHRVKVSKDTDTYIKSKIYKKTKKSLFSLKFASANQDIKQQYKNFEKILNQYLAISLELNSHGIIRENLIKQLKKKEIKEEYIQRMIDLLNRSNRVSFAPGETQGSQLEEDIYEAMELITEIEKKRNKHA